jgi:Zn-finger nucleic acid-binding protein
MKCPKCGYDLETVKFRGVSIDKCFHCNGTWLDAGELQLLAGGDLAEKVAAVFKR